MKIVKAKKKYYLYKKKPGDFIPDAYDKVVVQSTFILVYKQNKVGLVDNSGVVLEPVFSKIKHVLLDEFLNRIIIVYKSGSAQLLKIEKVTHKIKVLLDAQRIDLIEDKYLESGFIIIRSFYDFGSILMDKYYIDKDMFQRVPYIKMKTFWSCHHDNYTHSLVVNEANHHGVYDICSEMEVIEAKYSKIIYVPGAFEAYICYELGRSGVDIFNYKFEQIAHFKNVDKILLQSNEDFDLKFKRMFWIFRRKQTLGIINNDGVVQKLSEDKHQDIWLYQYAATGFYALLKQQEVWSIFDNLSGNTFEQTFDEVKVLYIENGEMIFFGKNKNFWMLYSSIKGPLNDDRFSSILPYGVTNMLRGKESYEVVLQNQKRGILNIRNGEYHRHPEECDKMHFLDVYIKDYRYILKKGNKYTIENHLLEKVFDIHYHKIRPIYLNSLDEQYQVLFKIWKENEVQILNESGEVIIQDNVDDIQLLPKHYSFSYNDVYIFRKNNKLGIKDFNYKTIVPAVYHKISEIYMADSFIAKPVIDAREGYGFFAAKLFNRWGLINLQNNVLIDFQYTSEKIFVVYTTREGHGLYCIYNSLRNMWRFFCSITGTFLLDEYDFIHSTLEGKESNVLLVNQKGLDGAVNFSSYETMDVVLPCLYKNLEAKDVDNLGWGVYEYGEDGEERKTVRVEQ